MSLSHLIPVPTFQSGFTTSPSLHHPHLTHVSLSDGALGVHKTSSRTSHRIVTPPAPVSSLDDDDDGDGEAKAQAQAPPPPPPPPPTTAWEAFYPKGSINPSAPLPGGFGFYLSGPPGFAQRLEGGAREVVMSYRMMLQRGWQWVKGGKLPGVFGGVGDQSYTCTGGRQDNRCKCFDLRPMWRPASVGELYAYVPLTPHNSSRLLSVPPLSKANPDYGISVGRGSFRLDRAVGRWVSVAFRVRLNDLGKENGEIQLWIDGKSVISVSGLVLCGAEGGKIKGMHFQTFFGGHTDDWASPKDQRAWFADVSGVIVR